MGEYFDIHRFFERIPQILPYLSVTFQIVFFSMLFGTLLGVLVAVLRIRKVPVLHQLLGVYISFMRGTPLLIQMYVVYYGLPLIAQLVFGININRWDTLVFVIIAVILNEGAFLGEIFRGAILSVPPIQSEAGYSIGMTNAQTFLRIVLPQAVVVAIPGYGSDIISVFQNTSLVFVLGVIDIMGRAKTLGQATGHALEGLLVVALIFICISLILKQSFIFIENKMHYGRRSRNGI